jgi:hypothetical protein
LRKPVREKELARTRRKIGDPNWNPTGVLSGGGMIFSYKVDERLRRLYNRSIRS